MGCNLLDDCAGCPYGCEFGCDEENWNPNGRRAANDEWDYDPYPQEERMSDSTDAKSDSRAGEIIEWLSQSELAHEFKKGEGFLVGKGPLVRLTDGTTMDLFDWLSEEGLAGGSTVAGYSVAYSGPDSEYGEKLSFFKVEAVDVPFSRRSSEVAPALDDEEIPF